MAATLTRSQFETACKAYVAKHSAPEGSTLLNGYPTGWTWREHALLPHLGYLSRSVLVLQEPKQLASEEESDDGMTSDANDADVDPSAAATSTTEVLTVQQHVVRSATFQVPTFYWTMHRRDGTPLSLDEMLTTGFLRTTSLPEHDKSRFALSPPDSPFPLLSQGDHPILGTPSWYLHPCHSAEAVAELLSEVHIDEWSEEECLLGWLELWFVVLGGVVDLGSGCS
ncbi:hypothetical protein OBBRIDRAFT_790122 [Obba rivulosa]|uniref:Ubiquitin-like-conjugating enzyme ATG10 n=1 Tax=Obba rivulosa TaxID=1052685 RepID=A0A8E2DQ07_9APHY|nr:hypothetical protein OBBRIDRAFT_790122 [Obba rivulosa]